LRSSVLASCTAGSGSGPSPRDPCGRDGGNRPSVEGSFGKARAARPRGVADTAPPGHCRAAWCVLRSAEPTVTKSSCTCAIRVVSFRLRRDGLRMRRHSRASPDPYIRYPVAIIRPACSNRQAA